MKKILLFSIIINIVLILFIFPESRLRIQFLFYKMVGMSVPDSIPVFKELMLLQNYKPVPVLDTTDARKIKLPSMPVIETHGHLGKLFSTNPEDVSKKLTEYNIIKFINLSFTSGEEFIKMKKEYSDPRIIHFSTFNWKRLKEDNSFELLLQDVKQDIQNGSKGIKLWKDFGLYLKKKNGERLKIDDPELDPIFEECEKNGLIISIHTADPKAFFSEIDEKNERYEELVRHPEWSFASKEFPSQETVLKERNNRFKRHPKLKFIALHFGEYADDLVKARKLLLENPNVYFDIAARIDELGRQPEKTKKFFEEFRNRILFGVDGPPDSGKLEIYSRFLETKDEYFDYYPKHKPRKGFWKIYGLGLDKQILEKIYFKNAEEIYK